MNKELDKLIGSLSKAAIPHKGTLHYTDSTDMALAKLSNPESYHEYFREHLKNVGIGESISIPLKDNKKLDLYKVEEGLYSGVLKESDGTIIHNLDRVTLPEISAHLSAKEVKPLVEEAKEIIEEKQDSIDNIEEKEVKTAVTPVVININIQKSEEDMDELDKKINGLRKAEKQEGSDIIKVEKPEEKKSDKIEDTKKEMPESPEKEKEPEEDKGETHKLISHTIKALRSHHKDGHSENTGDLSKFLVYLHGKGKEDESDDEKAKKGMKKALDMLPEISEYPTREEMKKAYIGFEKLKQKVAEGGASDPGAVAASIGRAKYGKKKFQEAAASGKKMKGASAKKSFDDFMVDMLSGVEKSDMQLPTLVKAESVKFTKEEGKQIFDMMLKDIIRDSYYYLKSNSKMLESDIIETIKKKANESIIRRMTWDEKFLMAKRSVGYDEKYLEGILEDTDFESLDLEYQKYKDGCVSPMYLSKEAYKIFSVREGVNKKVIDSLEKGNNFFKMPVKKAEELVPQYKEEWDYENMSKAKVRKNTDALNKALIDKNIKKR